MRFFAAWLIVLIAAGCNVGGASPATLRAIVSTSAPNAPLNTATPISHALPVDPTITARLDDVQSDRLIITIDTLVKAGTRHVLSTSDDPRHGIEAARTFIVSQLRALRTDSNVLQVWTQPVPVTIGGVTTTPENVVAVLGGTDLNAGVIVVGAHYDSVDSANQYNGVAPAPGANANGSGVAALLEIVRIMAGTKHRTTLMFVAFTAEESGRQGSLAFIADYLNVQTPPIVPRAMLNLDTIGGNLSPIGQPGPDSLRAFSADPNDSGSRALARQMRLAAGIYPGTLAIVVQSSSERNGHSGDQQSFEAAGLPAIRLIEGVEDTSRQRSPRDTLDGIQSSYLLAATRTALAVLLVMTDGPSPPTELTLQSVNGLPTLRWNPVSEAVGYVIALRRATSITFEQVTVTDGAPQFSDPTLASYDWCAIASFDGHGLLGALSAEYALTTLATPTH